ncbi:MAG TPA: hypothetical protein VF274_05875 [Alphaproteobacteria bacterium]
MATGQEATMAHRARISWAVCAVLCLGDGGFARADERFAGTWRAEMSAGGVGTAIQMVMLHDGTFNTVISSDGDNLMRIAGSYTVIDGGTIRFINRDYSPRERCITRSDGHQRCMAVELPPEETDSYRFENGGRTLVIANPEAGVMTFRKVEQVGD